MLTYPPEPPRETHPPLVGSTRPYAARVRVLTVVGNRPQFVKAAPLSVALREAGIDEVVVHTGQHWDDELSQVFIDELGLDEPAHRLDLRTADVETLTGPLRAAIEAESPDAVVVLGDTNSTLAGARAAASAGIPIAHVEAGLRSGDLSMPEERARIEVDGLAALLLCPDERSAATLEAEGVWGRAEVVGDVMADATLRFAPIARERVPPPHPPGTYVVATVHREANVRPERLRRIVEGLSRLEEPVVLPAHPRTPRSARSGGDPARGERRAPRAARLPRLRLGRVPGEGDRDRLGRTPEGGVLVPRPVRHDAPLDGVGRHRRGGRERARRRRPGRDRGGGARRRVPAGRAAALRRRACGRADRSGTPRAVARGL